MAKIPSATAIILTADERAVLEALTRSTKSKARMQLRARIVLLAADGTSTREIGRRAQSYGGSGRDRARDAAPKYGPADQKRILALLDQPPPAGYSNWTASLLARTLGNVHEQYIGGPIAPEPKMQFGSSVVRRYQPVAAFSVMRSSQVKVIHSLRF